MSCHFIKTCLIKRGTKERGGGNVEGKGEVWRVVRSAWRCQLFVKGLLMDGDVDKQQGLNVNGMVYVYLDGMVQVYLGGMVQVYLDGMVQVYLGRMVQVYLGGMVQVYTGGMEQVYLGGMVQVYLGVTVKVYLGVMVYQQYRHPQDNAVGLPTLCMRDCSN